MPNVKKSRLGTQKMLMHENTYIFILYFREKGYIPVDFNSMLMSVTLTCVSGDGYIQTEKTGPPYDIYLLLYNSVVLQFIRMVSITTRQPPI